MVCLLASENRIRNSHYRGEEVEKTLKLFWQAVDVSPHGENKRFNSSFPDVLCSSGSFCGGDPAPLWPRIRAKLGQGKRTIRTPKGTASISSLGDSFIQARNFGLEFGKWQGDRSLSEG